MNKWVLITPAIILIVLNGLFVLTSFITLDPLLRTVKDITFIAGWTLLGAGMSWRDKEDSEDL